MPSITDAAAHVAAAGAPVLFLDTCNILDVIRSPERGRKLAGCVEAASELLAMATAPVRCTLVVGSFVPDEWKANVGTVAGGLNRHLERMDREADDFHGLCTHLGVSLPFGRLGYAASGRPQRLHDLSRDLLAAAVALDTDPAANARAFGRVIGSRRPSGKTGQAKDCAIFEECLEVCRQLQAAGFSRKMVFCSSNAADYCDPGVEPHPDIATDCAAVGLTFTTNLPWAAAELKS